MNEPRVRRCVAEDLPALRVLASFVWDDAQEVNAEAEAYARAGRYSVVATLGDQVVGCALAERRESGAFLRCVSVVPWMRREGVMSLLVRDVSAWAAGPLGADSWADRKESLCALGAVGFVESGREGGIVTFSRGASAP